MNDLDKRIDELESEAIDLLRELNSVKAQISDCNALKYRQEIAGFLTQLTLGFEFNVIESWGDKGYEFSGFSWADDYYGWKDDAPIHESSFTFLEENQYIYFKSEYHINGVWCGNYTITREGREYLKEIS